MSLGMGPNWTADHCHGGDYLASRDRFQSDVSDEQEEREECPDCGETLNENCHCELCSRAYADYEDRAFGNYREDYY